MSLEHIPDSKALTYMYTFDITFTNPNDSSVSIKPSKINHVIKTNDYLSNAYSTLKIEMVIGKKDLFTLSSIYKDVIATIKVTCTKYNLNNPEKEKSGGEQIGSEAGSYVDSEGVYEPIFDKATFPSNFRMEEYEDDSRFNQDMSKNQFETETMAKNILVSFFPLKAVKAFKYLYNFVFESASPGTALLYILNKSGFDKCIVDKPANEYEYANIIVPPYQLRPAIEHLQARYGIYEYGLLLYYDDNVFYVLDRFNTKHEHADKDPNITTVKVFEPDIKPIPIVATQEDDDGTLTCDSSFVLETYDESVAAGENEGNNIMFSNFKMGINSLGYSNGSIDSTKANPVAQVLKRNLSTHSSSGVKTTLDYDELNNAYNMASYFNASEAIQNKYHFTLSGICTKSFKPNKFICLKFDNEVKSKLYDGNYHMIRNVLTYSSSRPDQNSLICNADIFMCKKASS